MNKLLKIFAVVAPLVAVVIGLVLSLTSGLTETANGFFEAVKQQDMAKARGYLSEEFSAKTDEAALKAFLSESAILNFKEASWSGRSVTNDRGELTGSITTETGGNVPIQVSLVKEKDAWKIYALQKPAAGVQSSGATGPSVPSKEQQISMTKKAIHDFAVSVNNKNMEHFRNSISKAWKDDFSTKRLNEAYGAFFDIGDLTVLDSFEPSLEGDALINKDGWLIIKGRYPTKPNQVVFEHKYISEGAAWKLSGFNIRIE